MEDSRRTPGIATAPLGQHPGRARTARAALIASLIITALLWAALPATADTDAPVTAPTAASLPLSGSYAEYASTAIDSHGNTVLVVPDVQTRTLHFLRCNDASCAGDDDVAIPVATDVWPHYTAVALDAHDLPVIVFADGEQRTLNVIRCDDLYCTGTEVAATVATQVNISRRPALVLDTQSRLVFAYEFFESINLLRCDDVACTEGAAKTTVLPYDENGKGGQGVSLALDGVGNPVLTYFDSVQEDLVLVRCLNALCSEDARSFTTLDSVGSVGRHSSLALDTADRPVIAYNDQTAFRIKLARCADAGCETVTLTTVAPDLTAADPRLALDGDANPILAFGDRWRGRLAFLRCNDAVCGGGDDIIARPDTGGQFTTLGFDVDGYAVMVHLGGAWGNTFRVVHCGSDTCTVPPVVSIDPHHLSVAKGSNLKLYATGSDPDGGEVTLAWDLDGDQEFDDGVGSPVNFDATARTVGTHPIAVRVTDDEGVHEDATASVTVTSALILPSLPPVLLPSIPSTPSTPSTPTVPTLPSIPSTPTTPSLPSTPSAPILPVPPSPRPGDLVVRPIAGSTGGGTPGVAPAGPPAPGVLPRQGITLINESTLPLDPGPITAVVTGGPATITLPSFCDGQPDLITCLVGIIEPGESLDIDLGVTTTGLTAANVDVQGLSFTVPAPPITTPRNTAIQAAHERFPAAGGQSFAAARDGAAAHVVLARDDVFADSLTGSTLTADGPLLYTGGDQLDAASLAEIDRVLGGSGTVYLLGGTAALSDAIEQAVVDAGYTPVRLAGATRVQTGFAIAEEVVRLNGEPEQVAVARADGAGDDLTSAWADAVALGGWAARTGQPILLTPTGAADSAITSWLDRHADSDVVVVGGQAAISEDTAAALAANAQRVGGVNRWATAVAIATELWPGPPEGYLVTPGTTQSGWAHTLAAAGLAADLDRPILLTSPEDLPSETAAQICATGSPAQTLLISPAEDTAPAVTEALAADCGGDQPAAGATAEG